MGSFCFFNVSLPPKQGLMRQLVLVPGADATHHICPSSKPQLAALSVPLILLDLPVTEREGDGHLSTHSNLQMYFFLTRSQRTTPTLSVLPFFFFHSPISSVNRAQTVKKREKGGSRPEAVVFAEAARWAVVQSGEERPLPLWRHSVDRCSSGWGCKFVPPSNVVESRFRI